MKDLSRRVRKLRRRLYRQLPAATCNRIVQPDPRASCAEIITMLHQGNFGVGSSGAALALCRACRDRGLPAWCYEFGFPESLTYTVTVVEIDGALHVHDAFCNLGYPLGLYDMLDSLRYERMVEGKCAQDRKIYIMDPACEPEATVRWLEANAARELDPVDGLRRLELVWTLEAFAATHSGIDAALRDLADRGHPADLRFLMLYPVAVSDGQTDYDDRPTMPLLGARDLQSPAAGLRCALRDVAAERARGSEQEALIGRLRSETAEAHSQLSAVAQEADRLRAERAQLTATWDKDRRVFAAECETWLQQKVALQASRGALEGELAKTRGQLAAAVDLRAQRDSQIAQLRAEIADAAQQFERETRCLKRRIEEGSREIAELRSGVVMSDSRAGAAEAHAIEASHHMAALIEEVDRLRHDYQSLARGQEALSREKTRLEAVIAASPAVRFAAMWRRFTAPWEGLFRAGRTGHYPADNPPGKFRR